MLYRARDPDQDLEELELAWRLRRGCLLDEILQRSTVDELHDDEERGTQAEADEADYVLVIHLGEHDHFIRETLEAVLVDETCPHLLDRDLFVCLDDCSEVL